MSSKETSGVCDQKDFVCKLNVVASSVNVCAETEQEEGGKGAAYQESQKTGK